MGSKACREAHMLKYGSTIKELEGDDSFSHDVEARLTPRRQAEITERLYQGQGRRNPQNSSSSTIPPPPDGGLTPNTNNLTFFPNSRETSSQLITSNNNNNNTNTTTMTSSALIASSQSMKNNNTAASKRARGDAESMRHLFPKFIPSAEDDGTLGPSTYPEDWKQNPRDSGKDTAVKWLISELKMKNVTKNPTAYARGVSVIDTMLREEGVSPINENTKRYDIRRQLRDPRRFCLLLDIVTTKRNILSGAPHAVAAALYSYVDNAFPVYVKFIFIGITDNTTQRVARDVFYRDKISGSNARKLNFENVDSDHLYIADRDESVCLEMERKGTEMDQQKEEERFRRYFTPRYVAPPPPRWLKPIQEKIARQKEREKQEEQRKLETSLLPQLEYCLRCWSHAASPTNNQSRSSSPLAITAPQPTSPTSILKTTSTTYSLPPASPDLSEIRGGSGSSNSPKDPDIEKDTILRLPSIANGTNSTSKGGYTSSLGKSSHVSMKSYLRIPENDHKGNNSKKVVTLVGNDIDPTPANNTTTNMLQRERSILLSFKKMKSRTKNMLSKEELEIKARNPNVALLEVVRKLREKKSPMDETNSSKLETSGSFDALNSIMFKSLNMSSNSNV